MNDLEIIKWLRDVKPERAEQKKALEAAERAFYNSIYFVLDEGVEDFLTMFTKDELRNKPSGDLYEEYVEYGTGQYDEIVTHSVFTKSVGYLFNLRSKVVKIDGKSIRVYK